MNALLIQLPLVYLDHACRLYSVRCGDVHCWDWRMGWSRSAIYSTPEDLFRTNPVEVDPARYGITC